MLNYRVLISLLAGIALTASSLPVRADSSKPAADGPKASLRYQFSEKEIARGAQIGGRSARSSDLIELVAPANLTEEPEYLFAVAVSTPGQQPKKCDTSNGTCSPNGSGRVCGQDSDCTAKACVGAEGGKAECVQGGAGRPCAMNDDCNFHACVTGAEGAGACVLGGNGAMCDPKNPDVCGLKRCRFADRLCVYGGSGPLCDDLGKRCAAKYCTSAGSCAENNGKGNWKTCENNEDCDPRSGKRCDPAQPGKCIDMGENGGDLPRCVKDSECDKLYCTGGACTYGFRDWSAKSCTQANAEGKNECTENRCLAGGACGPGGTGVKCDKQSECGRLACDSRTQPKPSCQLRIGTGANLHGCTEVGKECTPSAR